MITGAAWIPVIMMLLLVVWALKIGRAHERRRQIVKPDPVLVREWDRIFEPIPYEVPVEKAGPIVALDDSLEESLDDREIASVGYGPYG